MAQKDRKRGTRQARSSLILDLMKKINPEEIFKYRISLKSVRIRRSRAPKIDLFLAKVFKDFDLNLRVKREKRWQAETSRVAQLFSKEMARWPFTIPPYSYKTSFILTNIYSFSKG